VHGQVLVEAFHAAIVRSLAGRTLQQEASNFGIVHSATVTLGIAKPKERRFGRCARRRSTWFLVVGCFDSKSGRLSLDGRWLLAAGHCKTAAATFANNTNLLRKGLPSLEESKVDDWELFCFFPSRVSVLTLAK
jgi:hypothetical protein